MNAPTPAPARHISATRRNLRLSWIDGSWYCVMWAVGECNIAVFGVALGMSPTTAGLLDTVPRLCGSLLQTASHRAVVALGSHKRWIVITATVQALIFIPLAIGALLGGMPTPLVFLLAALYWAAAWGCANAWTTFISTLVPRRVRPAFFARRNRVLNVVIVASTLLGGWLLELGRGNGRELLAFAALFAAACFGRLISARFLHLHTELVPIPSGIREVPVRELLGRYRHGPGGRLLAYRLSVEFALQTSTPFIVPFLLKERGLEHDYTMFGVLIAAPILAKALSLPLWGRIAHTHGPRSLLRIGGLAMIPLPVLWTVHDSMPFMLLVQLITGVCLGAYELASFLLVFDAVPERERTSVMSKFNVAQFTVTLLGSLIGAYLLHSSDSNLARSVAGAAAGAGAGYTLVFAASALLRLLTLALLSRVPQNIAPGEVPETVGEELPPLAGSLEQSVIPTHDATPPDTAPR